MLLTKLPAVPKSSQTNRITEAAKNACYKQEEAGWNGAISFLHHTFRYFRIHPFAQLLYQIFYLANFHWTLKYGVCSVVPSPFSTKISINHYGSGTFPANTFSFGKMKLPAHCTSCSTQQVPAAGAASWELLGSPRMKLALLPAHSERFFL